MSITFYQAGTPASGAVTWFADPQSGAVITDGTTDGSGRFTASVPAGASVSVAMQTAPDPPEWDVYTIFATAPNDDLKMGDLRPAGTTGNLGTLSVSLPGAVMGAAKYSATIACQDGDTFDPTAGIELPVYPDCLGSDGKLAVLARALDTKTQSLAYSVATSVDPPQAGGNATVTMGAWRTDFAPFVATLASVPTGVGVVEADVSLERAGTRFDVARQQAVMPAQGGPLMQTFTLPQGLATRTSWKQSITYGVPMADGFQLLVRSSDAMPLPSSAALDATADLLPRVSMASGAIAANGVPSLSWQQAGDLSAGDGMVALAEWTNPNNSHLRWQAILPVTESGALALPDLPDALKKARGVITSPASAAIYAVEADYIAGYDQFRRGQGVAAIETGPPADMNVRVRVSTAGMVLPF